MGKAQECDLSVTGHLIVDKPFRWLISCSIFRCFEALPVCMLTLLAASPQPMQVLSNRDIHVSIFLTRLYQEGFLAYCSHQVVFVFLTFTRSHLWESQLFPVSFSPWISKLSEAMRQLLSQNPDPSESGSCSRHRGVLCCAWCSWLVLIWSWMVPSFSWGPEP